MSRTSKWQPIATAPEGVEVETKVDDGGCITNLQMLVRVRGRWCLLDRTTYCYFTPTHWRPVHS